MRRDLKDHPLAKLIREARAIKMSDAEKKAQSASWQRGELAMGNDAQEAAYRKLLRDRDALLEACKAAVYIVADRSSGGRMLTSVEHAEEVRRALNTAITNAEKP